MWREVRRPRLLRPPVFLMLSVSFLTGLLPWLSSSNPFSSVKRGEGVRGRKALSAMVGCRLGGLGDFDLFAGLQGDDGLFPLGAPAHVRAAVTGLELSRGLQ